MNLKYVSRRRPPATNNMMGIGYVALNRAPRHTYRSVHHFPKNRFKMSTEYECMGPPIIHSYRCGFHIFKTVVDARASAELGVNVICKVVYRNIFNYGQVLLGGHINLKTGDMTNEYKAPVIVSRYRMIIEEVS